MVSIDTTIPWNPFYDDRDVKKAVIASIPNPLSAGTINFPPCPKGTKCCITNIAFVHTMITINYDLDNATVRIPRKNKPSIKLPFLPDIDITLKFTVKTLLKTGQCICPDKACPPTVTTKQIVDLGVLEGGTYNLDDPKFDSLDDLMK